MDNLVDIVIPYYNKKDFIDRAIDSCLNQPQLSVINKIIVIDDGSDKEDKDYLFNKYGDNKKIRIVRQPNRGLFKARLRGLNCCEAPFMCFLDADDELYPTWSTMILDYLNKWDNITKVPVLAYEMCCVYKDFVDYDCKETYLANYNQWSKLVYDRQHFDHSACNKLVPSVVYREINYLVKNIIFPSENLNFMEDVLFMSILMSVADIFIYTSEVGYVYHKEAENSILKTTADTQPLRAYFAELLKSNFKATSAIKNFVEQELKAIEE